MADAERPSDAAQVVLCAFTIDELEQLLDWCHWKEEGLRAGPGLPAGDRELLERIKLLAAKRREEDRRAATRRRLHKPDHG